MKNLSMEDVYESHHPSSTITRFTSLSEENIVLTSPGQEKPLSTLQRSHGPLENLQTAAFTVQPYSSLFTPETAPPLICALGAYGSMYEEV